MDKATQTFRPEREDADYKGRYTVIGLGLPEEYWSDRAGELYETKGIQIGKDGAIILDGDQVYDLTENTMETADYFHGMHP